MAEQSSGPKVEKVTKGGKGKSAKPGKAKAGEGAAVKVTKTHSKADAAKAAKEAKRAAAKAAKESKKAARKEQKEAQKAEQEKKKVASGQVKAAKKRIKDEKTEAVKIARENTGKKLGIKNKKTIFIIIAAIVLALLIIGATVFLIRMIFGGKEEPNTPPEDITSSSQAQLQGGTAGGSSAGEPVSSVSQTGSSSQGDSSSSQTQREGSESSAVEPSKNTSSTNASSASASQTGTAGNSESNASVMSKNLADQAVEGAAGTASVSALLGSGQGDPENMDIPQDNVIKQPKPGQIVGGTTVGGQEESPSSSAASSEAPRRPEANPNHETALTSPTQTQEVADFKFSEESLDLPPFDYVTSNSLEAAVHRDIEDYLDQKDDRPGVQISSVVIGGQYTLPDGTVRVLAYAWGSRYAIADNTLFDYGNLVGPCALDYRGGALQKIILARSGDQFEDSVREFCGDMTDVADRMVKHSYDLELRGQMLRNVSSYIRRNNIPVDFFRASGQVYNKDGSIYLPPDMQESQETDESQSSSAVDESVLQEDYRLIQDMPE